MSRVAASLLVLATVCLVGMGFVMIASTGPWVSVAKDAFQFQQQQTNNAYIGIALFLITYFCKPDWIRALAPFLFAIGLLLLALCYIPGIGEDINGSYRWVKIPSLPQFQPSEIGKITSIIGIAAYYARYSTMTHTFVKGFILPGALFSLPVLLILFEQDMDTAALLALVAAAIMFVIGVRLRYLLPVAILCVVCGTAFVTQSENRMKRITAFTQVEQYPTSSKEIRDINRQQWHALLAFGSGGAKGVGLGNGEEKHGYMPEAHTDFVLAVMGEEFGLCMTLPLVFCYVFLGMGGFLVAMQSRFMFSRILAIGLTLLILLPALINIAVTTAKMPVAGLPLPFVSYGGTNLVFSMVSIAMLLAISRESKKNVVETLPEIVSEPRPQRL